MKTLFFALFSLIYINLFAGGPWAEGKGNGYVEPSALFSIATKSIGQRYQVYSEIGVTDKLTLKIIIPFTYINNQNNPNVASVLQGKLFGISNVVLGGKYEVYKKKVVMSAGLDVELRTIIKEQSKGLRTGYEKYTIRPNYSVGFGIEKLYTYGEIRPGFSTNGFGHDINLIGEVGGKVDDKVWLAGYFEIKTIFKNGDFNDTDLQNFALNGYFRDRQNFLTMGAKFSALLYKGFGIDAALFYGKGINASGKGSSIAVKAGLYYDW